MVGSRRSERSDNWTRENNLGSLAPRGALSLQYRDRVTIQGPARHVEMSVRYDACRVLQIHDGVLAAAHFPGVVDYRPFFTGPERR